MTTITFVCLLVVFAFLFIQPGTAVTPCVMTGLSVVSPTSTCDGCTLTGSSLMGSSSCVGSTLTRTIALNSQITEGSTLTDCQATGSTITRTTGTGKTYFMKTCTDSICV